MSSITFADKEVEPSAVDGFDDDRMGEREPTGCTVLVFWGSQQRADAG